MRSNVPALLMYFLIVSLLLYTAVEKDLSKPSVLVIVGPGASEHVVKAITLDSDSFSFTVANRSTNLADYDIVVIYSATLDNATLKWLKSGGRVLYIPGFVSENDTFLAQLGNFSFASDEMELIENSSVKSQIVASINWKSAPRVAERLQFSSFKVPVNVYVLCRKVGVFEAEVKPFLFKASVGKGSLIFISAILSEEAVSKEPHLSFINWPYFNYLIYISMEELLGREGAKYGDWKYSPVPHGNQKIFFLIWPLVLTAVSFTAFYLVKAYCKRKPLRDKDLGWLVQRVKDKLSAWEEAGLHKQFAGLTLKYFFNALLMPWGIVWGIIWIRFIVKYPMSLGISDWLGGLTGIIWFVFDFGTSFAAIYYFSELRAKKPSLAIQYVQFFVWWQFLTGIVQVALITNISAWYLVSTKLAFVSWVLITMSLGQYPGFLGFTDIILRGMQRFDYIEIGNNVFGVITAITHGILTYFIREWLAQNIALGAILATCIALNIAGYINSWFGLLLWILLLKKLGLKIIPFLRADFDWNVAKSALSYGGQSMLGDAFIVFAWTLEVFLISEYIPNYGEWLAFFSIINGEFMLCATVCDLVTKTMPSMSEAHGYGLKKLLELYYIEMWVYANVLVFLIVAAALAVAKFDILGYYGPTWKPALILLPFQALFYYASPPAWVNDQIQYGTGHPVYRSAVTIFEQVMRISLMVIFVVYLGWGMIGAVVSYNIALILKDILTTMITRYKILKFKFYPWNLYIAPTIIMFLTILIMRVPALLVWNYIVGENPEEWILVAGVLPMTKGMLGAAAVAAVSGWIGLVSYVFLVGFFHAVDPNLFEDLRKSLGLIGPIGKLAALIGIPWAYYLGVRISSFKRFRIDIYDEAMDEMKKLNELKAKMIEGS